MLEGKSEKLGFQEMLSSPHWKIEVNKRKTKRIRESKKKIWKKEMNKKTMKNDLSWNDPWTDHPETRFGPTYPFFRNQEPWPILRTWKVHFDRTWIFGLKSFFFPWEIFRNQQGCCLFSSAKILDKPFTCSGWIFKCIIGQSKNEKV